MNKRRNRRNGWRLGGRARAERAKKKGDPRWVALWLASTPKGSRTPVLWLRTRYPRPLDDGGAVGQIPRSGESYGGGAGTSSDAAAAWGEASHIFAGLICSPNRRPPALGGRCPPTTPGITRGRFVAWRPLCRRVCNSRPGRWFGHDFSRCFRKIRSYGDCSNCANPARVRRSGRPRRAGRRSAR